MTPQNEMTIMGLLGQSVHVTHLHPFDCSRGQLC